MRWAVIENAGYERENLRREFATEADAWAWAGSHYHGEELDELHVDVAHWDEAGEFWSYDH